MTVKTQKHSWEQLLMQ